MPVTVDEQYVREHFASLGKAEYDAFFGRVSPSVEWTVMGSHALSGRYHSPAEFHKFTSQRLNPRMEVPLALQLTNCVVSGRQAAVELSAKGQQKSGKPFDNHYCWLVHYDDEGVIDSVRAYLDGILVNQAINENAGP